MTWAEDEISEINSTRPVGNSGKTISFTQWVITLCRMGLKWNNLVTLGYDLEKILTEELTKEK